ncbi:FtsB family cell division protein [Georgenia faecalis]|uniref:Septum formation initiator family protein n=1 Tax=Georgenia faecalis TaxID=2483799 RepID=A0ABV9D6J2_9MICO|nr:septum formation initiator family protein [Georgenia faecalis]
MTSRRPPDPRRTGSRKAGPGSRGAASRQAPSRGPSSARRPASETRRDATVGGSPSAVRGAGARRTGPATPDGDPPPPPTITLRGLGLFLVLLTAFIVLAPTLRHAIEQQEELRSLSAQVETARARNDELQADLERWQDPIYVQAQARDRLGYVLPGETSYRVVDPETVVGEGAETEDEVGPPQAAPGPWYVSLWDSVQVAGEAVPGEDVPGEDLPGEPAPTAPTPPAPTEEP